MIVSEVKALCPESHVYSLRENARYLIVVDRERVPFEAMQGTVESLDAAGIPVVVLAVEGDPGAALRLYEDVPKSLIEVVSRCGH